MIIEDINKFINIDTNYIAIVANGKFPSRHDVLSLLQNAELIVACDGAAKQLNQHAIIPDYVIGDNDSNDIQQSQAHHEYIYIADQNSNDLTKAINFVNSIAQQNINIIIFAANGLREDHAIANFALLAKYSDIFPNIIMISDYGVFNVVTGTSNTLKTMPSQQISFFSLSTDNVINCLELKWPLEKHVFEYLYSGTLNQATSEKINISSRDKIIIYRSFEIK